MEVIYVELPPPNGICKNQNTHETDKDAVTSLYRKRIRMLPPRFARFQINGQTHNYRQQKEYTYHDISTQRPRRQSRQSRQQPARQKQLM